MAAQLRFRDPAHTGPARRVVGLLVSSDCRRLEAVLLSATGTGLGLRADVVDSLTVPLPDETARLFARLQGGGCELSSLSTLGAQLAEIEAAVVAELLSGASVLLRDVVAVGVHDPGLWSVEPRAYRPLGDAARLAESSGLNVVDAFPARDVARGGLGGPITAVAEWVLLRHPALEQVLVDLGRTVRVTYLPADRGIHAASRILAFEVGPGMGLLDLLAQRLTTGRERFDPGGRLGVQGRRIPELVEQWLDDPIFRSPGPRWHPYGIRPERFLAEWLPRAADAGWSIRDLLCTATHLVAEATARAVRRHLPDDPAEGRVILTGGGQQNGMLLREITSRLEGVSVEQIGGAGLSAESLDPAGIAVLALLHLDQVPANHPAVTGTDLARVLGRLTPGSPQAWQQLVEHLSTTRTPLRPLRSAV